MISAGTGDDDRKQPCPRCNDYIEQVEQNVDCIDAIEARMNELKTFFATHEWVMIENVQNIKKLHNPAVEMDAESLQSAYAQSVRFKRLIDSVTRSLERMRSSCDLFGGFDENL
jgi:uncharacterized cysteine cluster protein YcgN (CxxCxxCC family)